MLPLNGYKSSSVKSDMQNIFFVAIRKKWKKSFSVNEFGFGSLHNNFSAFDLLLFVFFLF